MASWQHPLMGGALSYNHICAGDRPRSVSRSGEIECSMRDKADLDQKYQWRNAA